MEFAKGSKREVAEVKFLIHDLRVEKFVNDIIHFHVTLNTDLEIYNADRVRSTHSEDLRKLRSLANEKRKALRKYSHAVRGFLPDRTVIQSGMAYIDKIREICELVLDPLWGRFDKVVPFLPEESRSVRSRSHYRNCVRWICGVSHRIEYFLQERENRQTYEEFDVARDIYDFTNNIVLGYVTEKSASKVDIQFEKEGAAVVGGNRGRFRRMYFNLVMNAVDAMQENIVGFLKVRIRKSGRFLLLVVEDNGIGMAPDKIERLLSEKKNLDGELHSLGFVFVRQTIREFDGSLSIESAAGKGTKITVSIPYLPGKTPKKDAASKKGEYPTNGPSDSTRTKRLEELYADAGGSLSDVRALTADPAPKSVDAFEKERERRKPNRNKNCGRIIWNDYRASKAQYPGCIFSLSVNARMELDFFIHKPYEKYWNISHEDLSPMFFESTVRGRLEENAEKRPELILKTPHNAKEFLDLKKLPESRRTPDLFIQTMHDEYILITRKLVATGLPNDINVHATNIGKYFRRYPRFFESEPIPILRIAAQPLSSELAEDR